MVYTSYYLMNWKVVNYKNIQLHKSKKLVYKNDTQVF